MEFQGTKGKWKYEHIETESAMFHCVSKGTEIITFVLGDEIQANALLISKAPCFFEDAKNDLELFDKLLKSLTLGLQHLKNAIKERKVEKEQLLKEATEL